MSTMVPFTSNYQDRSNDLGYQFEFHCERCGNGYASSFQSSPTNMGGRLAQTAGGLFGGILGNAGYAAGNLSDMMRGPARDAALQRAVEEMRPFFMQCHRCGEWVCKQVCWNAEAGLCTNCAPKVTQELAAAQSEAQIEQMRDKVMQQNFTAGMDVKTPVVARCPHCGAEGQGGKFCAECGQPMATATTCSKCGAELKAGSKFCAECGTPAAG